MKPIFQNPEFNLLIAVARLENNPLSHDILLEIIQEVNDWGSLLNLAEYHGMMPLLYLALKDLDQGIIPAEFLTKLKIFFINNTQKNISLLSEVLSLVEKLKSINITTIPFKGPTLSKVLYDNYSIRQAGDLDILIKPKDVIPTIDFLLDSGYHYSLQHLSKNQLSALINISPTNHIQLFHDRSNLCIELHWALAPMYLMGRKEVELLWDSLSTIYINSIRINNFSPENLFSILCLHGYKHSWYRLFWLWEISYFCQSKQDLDWDRILKISEVFGGKRIISTSFLVANTILEIQIPETIENYILKDPGAKRISGQILFESNLNQIRNPNAINTEALKSKFRTKVKLFNRIKHLIGFSFTPNYFDIKSIDLPPKFHFIYYLIRPFRFIYQRFQNN